MDRYASDSNKYPDTSKSYSGLEVNHALPPQPAQYAPATGTEEKVDNNGQRKILGLSVGVFWAIIVVCALVIGGGVGGGVGAGLAGKKDCATSSDSTDPGSQIRTVTQTMISTPGATISQSGTPTASTRPASASVSPAPESPCTSDPAINGTSIVARNTDGNALAFASQAQEFRIYCNTNWPGGAFYGNPQLHDIMYLYTPTFEDCVNACGEYNVGYLRKQQDGIDVAGGLCRAVALVLADGQGCYLKNGTGKNDTGTSGNVKIDSALLLG